MALWIFGYGSLVWRPAFPFVERRHGYVEGWSRRFWQGSTDHRGVPGAPGRVVLLVEELGARCFGTAYKLAESERDGVLRQLDHREQGGYVRHELDVVCGVERIPAVAYMATADNPSYLGPAPLSSIAAQVKRARGPSGANSDYVLELERALAELGESDQEVSQLAALLRSER